MKLYKTRYLGGNYTEMAKAMGGYAERITKPEDISPAINRAKDLNAKGSTVLLEFITSSEELARSEPQPMGSYWFRNTPWPSRPSSVVK